MREEGTDVKLHNLNIEQSRESDRLQAFFVSALYLQVPRSICLHEHLLFGDAVLPSSGM